MADVRQRLPDERNSITHRFAIHDAKDHVYEGYITVGLYQDGRPGEVFVRMSQQGAQAHGDTIGGLLDGLGIMASIALQHGAPLETIVGKLVGQRYEPSGWTESPDIKRTTSPADYLGRYLAKKFMPSPPSSIAATGIPER